MTPLLEQPLVVLFVGSFFVGVAAIVWVQTQHPRAFFALVGSIIVLAGGLAIEQFVVTPAEVVEGRLFDVAQALEANDVDAVLSFVAQDATELKDEIRRTMRLASVKKVSIKSNLKVRLGHSGQTADAKFNATATLVGGGSEMPVPRLMVVHYRLENGRWQIVSYEAFDPRGDMVPRGLRDKM